MIRDHCSEARGRLRFSSCHHLEAEIIVTRMAVQDVFDTPGAIDESTMLSVFGRNSVLESAKTVIQSKTAWERTSRVRTPSFPSEKLRRNHGLLNHDHTIENITHARTWTKVDGTLLHIQKSMHLLERGNKPGGDPQVDSAFSILAKTNVTNLTVNCARQQGHKQ